VGAALTIEQIAQLIAFVAPGFIARRVFAARYPHREPAQFTQVVSAVVFSLPIVALTNVVARWLGMDPGKVTRLPYVLLLIGLAAVTGYLIAGLWSSSRFRRLFGRLGLAYQPEDSIYAVLLRLPPEAVVTVQLTDGSKLSGTPAAGPGRSDGGNELMITHPAWWNAATGGWTEDGAGGAVIVSLGQVRTITLDREPS
jgi:hypothetical protein